MLLYSNTNLNFAITGANSKVASFFGPGQRADVVLFTLQFHEGNDTSFGGVPQVNTVMKGYSENTVTAPVKKIQI